MHYASREGPSQLIDKHDGVAGRDRESERKVEAIKSPRRAPLAFITGGAQLG